MDLLLACATPITKATRSDQHRRSRQARKRSGGAVLREYRQGTANFRRDPVVARLSLVFATRGSYKQVRTESFVKTPGAESSDTTLTSAGTKGAGPGPN